MKDVTPIMNNYRECIRHIWNMQIKDIAANTSHVSDVISEFEEIDKHVFATIVLCTLKRLNSINDYTRRPLNFLRVVPITDNEIPIMINRPSNDNNKYWDEPVNKVRASDVELHFIGYFDWEQIGFRNYEYYHVKIASFISHPQLVGREALLSSTYALVQFNTNG